MTNLKLWKAASGLDLDDSFVDLPVSPHYWKPTTLSVVCPKANTMVNWRLI